MADKISTNEIREKDLVFDFDRDATFLAHAVYGLAAAFVRIQGSSL